MAYNRNDFSIVGYKEGLESKTLLCKVTELPPPNRGVEFYRSVFAFRPVDMEGKDSLRDISDATPVYAEFLPIDLDDSNDLPKVWEETKTLSGRLKDKGVAHHVYFSGNKGFHVLIPTASFGFMPTEDNEVLKRMAVRLAGDLTSFDPSVYNKSRVLRAPNSYNKKGQRYKVKVGTLLTLEEILEKAKAPEDIKPDHTSEINPFMVELYNACKAKELRSQVEYQGHIFNTIFVPVKEGERNEGAYTVARKLAKRGFSEADALAIMLEYWNPKYASPPLRETEVQKVVENAYKKGMNHIVDTSVLKDVSYVVKGCVTQLVEDFKRADNSFFTGYKDIDDFTMGFEPETVTFIVARSGSFKSAVLTNILQRGSKLAGKPALFFSMEMGYRTLMPRCIQMSQNVTKKEALRILRGEDATDKLTKTMEDFSNVKFIFKSALTTESMLAIIDTHIEKYGQLSAIGIDYLSLFAGCNNNTERTAKQAAELKTVIAKAAKCPVFCLVQASKRYEGNYGDIELDRSCPKDSDAILDLGDYSFGIWGHWFNVTGEPEKHLYGKFFKSRGYDEEVFGDNPYFYLDVDKPKMLIKDIRHTKIIPEFKQVGGTE